MGDGKYVWKIDFCPDESEEKTLFSLNQPFKIPEAWKEQAGRGCLVLLRVPVTSWLKLFKKIVDSLEREYYHCP